MKNENKKNTCKNKKNINKIERSKILEKMNADVELVDKKYKNFTFSREDIYEDRF